MQRKKKMKENIKKKEIKEENTPILKLLYTNTTIHTYNIQYYTAAVLSLNLILFDPMICYV